MIRKIIYISIFAFFLQVGTVNAGSTGSEELKGNSSENTTKECFEGFEPENHRNTVINDKLSYANRTQRIMYCKSSETRLLELLEVGNRTSEFTRRC